MPSSKQLSPPHLKKPKPTQKYREAKGGGGREGGCEFFPFYFGQEL